MNRALPFSLALALAASAGASTARAQGADPAAAQGLFDQAKQLVAQGRLGEACPKFLASFKLDPKPGTAVNLADCYEKNGQIASAWARYLEAGSLAQRAGQAEREQYAKEHAAALEPRIARLTVNAAAAAAGLEVLRDGASIDLAALGAPVPVDPGRHQIEARAPGKKPWVKVIEIPQGPAKVTVDIPALEDGSGGPVSPPPAAGLPPAGSPAAGAGAGEAGSSPRKPVGLALIGIGGAGLVVGGIMGGLAVAKHGDLVSKCPQGTCTNQQDAIGSYHLLGNGSTAALVVGGVVAAAGVVLVITAPRAPAKQAWVRPVVGPGFAGAAGRF